MNTARHAHSIRSVRRSEPPGANSIRGGPNLRAPCAALFPAAALIAAALLATSASAHHSVPVNFDQSREISVTGVLSEVKWLNPHSHFRMDVTNDDGSTVEWLVEMGAINTMRRAGFQTEQFSLGQLVTITGWPGRRDRVVYLNRAQMEDGTELLCLGARCNLTEED